MGNVHIVASLLAFVLAGFLPSGASGGGFWRDSPESCAAAFTAWTSGVKADRNNMDSLSGSYSGKAIYFWARIKGDGRALEYVKANKSLPALFSWGQYVGGEFQRDKRRKFFLTQEEIKGLEVELANAGHWDFRIWDFREKPSYWVVRLLFPDGTCNGGGGESGDCGFEISFQAGN